MLVFVLVDVVAAVVVVVVVLVLVLVDDVVVVSFVMYKQASQMTPSLGLPMAEAAVRREISHLAELKFDCAN